MQIAIIEGVYTDANSDYRAAYPRNMYPVPKAQGVSSGYLRPSEGATLFVKTEGRDRGGFVFSDLMYRVAGTKLYSVREDGAQTIIGTLPDNGENVRFAGSFDRLAVASARRLFYVENGVMTEVTDPDLGNVFDVIWVDGYFMTTDGENLVVTELNDPLAIDALKYGSSEIEPDPIIAILKVRNEVYAVNRYTIEIFNNVGGEGFPFQRVEGAQITRGAIGRDACVVHDDAIVFVGSGKNEALGVYVGSNGTSIKISGREIDLALKSYSYNELKNIVLERRAFDSHGLIYVHLPDRTFVYDFYATKATGTPVWFVLTSGTARTGAYVLRNYTYSYSKWFCGHLTDSKIGILTDTTQEHFGEKITWEFSTQILYNEGAGALVRDLELVALPGRSAFGLKPTIKTQYSFDGTTFSQPSVIPIGKLGERETRIAWRNQGMLKNTRIQKFSGDSDARLSVSRLELRAEPLRW